MLVNIGTYNIPDLQKQYAKIQDELEVLTTKRVMAKYRLRQYE